MLVRRLLWDFQHTLDMYWMFPIAAWSVGIEHPLNTHWSPIECPLSTHWAPIDYPLSIHWAPIEHPLIAHWLPIDHPFYFLEEKDVLCCKRNMKKFDNIYARNSLYNSWVFYIDKDDLFLSSYLQKKCTLFPRFLRSFVHGPECYFLL